MASFTDEAALAAALFDRLDVPSIPVLFRERYHGEDLDDPKAVLLTALVLAEDLDSLLTRADELADQQRTKRLLPGLARYRRARINRT